VIEEVEEYKMIVAGSYIVVLDFEEDTLVQDFDKEIEAYMYLNDLKNDFGWTFDFVVEDIDFEESYIDFEEEYMDFVEQNFVVEVGIEVVVAYMYLNVEDSVVEHFELVVVNNYYFDEDYVAYMYLIYENYFHYIHFDYYIVDFLHFDWKDRKIEIHH